MIEPSIIIPAKGESRRLPGKNKRWLYPVIDGVCPWNTVVSTNDVETAWIAGFAGATLHDRRGQTGESIEDVVRQWLRDVKPRRASFAVLLATAPLVLWSDFWKARKLLTGKIDTVFAVARHRHGKQEAVADCGAFILCKTKPFLERRTFYDSPNIAIYVLPFARGQDVDTPEDAARVDWLLSHSGG